MGGAQGILAGNETRYLETALTLDIEIPIIIDIVIVFVYTMCGSIIKVVYAKPLIYHQLVVHDLNRTHDSVRSALFICMIHHCRL